MSAPSNPSADNTLAERELEAALAASERMLDAAMGDDWAAVATLQQERARHLAGFSPPSGAGGQVRWLLQRMKDINEQIRELAASHRDVLAARGRQMRHATRAASAYQRAAG